MGAEKSVFRFSSAPVFCIIEYHRRRAMTLEEITRQINGNEQTAEEQIKILRRNRMRLLDEIHIKQQLLDQLDYLIYEIGNKKKRERERKDSGS